MYNTENQPILEEIISLTPDSVRTTPIQPSNSPENENIKKPIIENVSQSEPFAIETSNLDLRSLTPISLSSEEILLNCVSDKFTPYEGEVSVKNEEIKMLERGETPVAPKKKKCCVIL